MNKGLSTVLTLQTCPVSFCLPRTSISLGLLSTHPDALKSDKTVKAAISPCTPPPPTSPPHPSVLHLQQKESEGNKGEGQVLYKKGGERMSTVSLVLMLPLSNFYLWRKKKEKRTLVHVWLKGTTGRKEGRRGTAGEPGYNMFVRHLSINADIAGAHSEGGQRVAAGGRGAASCRGLPKGAEEEGALPSLKRGC